MRALVASLVIASLISWSSPVAAKCARMGQRPVVLTPSVEVPADGGGIVVGTESVTWEQTDEGEAPQKGWGFYTGRDLGQPTITTLAPGLVVYSVPASLRTTGELVGGKGTVAKLTRTNKKVKLLAAPTLKAVVHASSASGRGRSSTTTVQLDGAAPADAVAMILVDARTKQARSWGAVTAGATSVVVYVSRRCGVLPTGTVESTVGDQVIVRWVDNRGRVSADSTPLAITKAP
jgi:hypothetical protein